jgi:hypothetical protein
VVDGYVDLDPAEMAARFRISVTDDDERAAYLDDDWLEWSEAGPLSAAVPCGGRGECSPPMTAPGKDAGNAVRMSGKSADAADMVDLDRLPFLVDLVKHAVLSGPQAPYIW